jgi:hypothetical protein
VHPASSPWFVLALAGSALVASLSLVGCDQNTCEGACSQYYGEDGCGRPSVLSNGTDSETAENNCVSDCREALYTTSGTELSGSDTGGYARLENEADAIEFIRCIADKDYSTEAFNETCADLFYDCRWIKW